jgi:hypothetical protein
MYDLNLLAYNDVPEDREERKDRRERSFTINHVKWHMVDFETVGEVSNSCSPGVGMRYNYHLMTPVDEFLEAFQSMLSRSRLSPYAGQLIHVTFHSPYFNELNSLGSTKQSLPGWGKKLSLIMLLALVFVSTNPIRLTRYYTALW